MKLRCSRPGSPGVAVIGALAVTGLASAQEAAARPIALPFLNEKLASPPIEWVPCPFDSSELAFDRFRVDPSRLRCGQILVPEDRSRADGRSLRLTFTIVKAEHSAPGAAPVVYLEGGPGVAALNAYVLGFEAPALATERDVITFDQRGTGRSEPLCPALDAQEREIVRRDLRDEHAAALRRRARQECIDELRRLDVDPAAYDMAATVADVEDLRRALGIERWTLLGRSYGGALAQRVIRHHPQTVHSVVLINPLPLDWLSVVDWVPTFARTLRRIGDECAAEHACHEAFADPLDELLAAYGRAETEPWTVDVDTSDFGAPSFTINGTELIAMIDALLYAAENTSHLPRVMRSLAERDSAVAAAVVGRVFGGGPFEFWPAVQYSVWCRDAVTADFRERLAAALADHAPALHGVGFPVEVCDGWPVVTGPAHERLPVESDIPALILSGGQDHVVPAALGTAMLSGLRNGWQVVFPFSAHVLPERSNVDCVLAIMHAFLANPRAAVDTSCVGRIEPRPYSTELPEWMTDAVPSQQRQPETVLALTAGAMVADLSPPPAAIAQTPVSAPVYPADLDAPKLARLVDEHLADARAAVDRLVAVTGPRTAANTLRPFDNAYNHGSMAMGLAAIAIHVHPDSAVRAEGQRAEQRVSRLKSDMTTDPRIARAFAALDTTGLTAEERLFAARILRDLRRAGADRDDATRQRLRAHFETLDRLGTVFVRNLAADTTTIVAAPDELAGLPPDWIAAHERDPDGSLVIATRPGDFFPIIRYASSRPLRQRAAIAFTNRGRLGNAAVLDTLLRTREEVARLLGYPHWAAYQAETRMAGSADTIRAFLARIQDAAAPARELLMQEYLARLRREDTTLAELRTWDLSHAAELTRRERYALDGREVRSYFPFAIVKQGLLELAGELFGLEFARVDVPVWHPSVEAYEVRENGRVLGRVYLDLHPRPGKYTHFAVAPLRAGIAGRQHPEAMLMTNFPGGQPGDPGLMEHSAGGSVTTFFHEFGHLLHALFAVRPYAATAWPDEVDFNEAPSQMLEEWAWHPAVLRRITRHVETGDPIPDDLVRRMHAADAFDRPTQAGLQAVFSAISVGLHDRPAAEIDIDSLTQAAFMTHLGVTADPRMHFATSVDHFGMGVYSATYYTYLWSQVIAKDLWSAFDPANPLDLKPARRYRDIILRPGGSRPAARLIEDFLGRPFGFASWQQWLEGRQ